jgi:hypothetical protein
MKFRKKPVVIEARHFKSSSFDLMQDLVLWVNTCPQGAWHDGKSIYIPTLEGEMRADVGDWIIKGVKSEFYPCKPDIFAATYDPA